ncbi:hypothetical protein OC846_004732 [Tilletia horrida]|uniref:Uncharacterized protein n=1 Tax=Tilletia horrida TaxID=155126 RepID=A0AAN6GPR3_9BASI|nr:hypothetical protein OC846_004732 [Tilletia horrida]
MAVSDKLQKEYPAPSNSSSSSSSGSATSSSSSSSSGGSSASTLTSDDSSAGKPRRFGIRLLDRVETPPTTATNAGGAAPAT